MFQSHEGLNRFLKLCSAISARVIQPNYEVSLARKPPKYRIDFRREIGTVHCDTNGVASRPVEFLSGDLIGTHIKRQKGFDAQLVVNCMMIDEVATAHRYVDILLRAAWHDKTREQLDKHLTIDEFVRSQLIWDILPVHFRAAFNVRS